MKGSAAFFLKYLGSNDTKFIIPLYQRYYSWKRENCVRLYRDLLSLIKDGSSTAHFFGSIVSVVSGKEFASNNSTTVTIIDGQQRLTTVSLLLLAIYNLLEQNIVKSDGEDLADQIYQWYLFNKFGENRGIKLCPVEADAGAYNALFKGNTTQFHDSKMTLNYEYFRNSVKNDVSNGVYTVDELYNAICKLQIIDISLNYDDNPQLIFESLNSTGLALSDGDKIRNFVLMGQKLDVQNRFYEDYWKPIEEKAGGEDKDISAFVQDYLRVKRQGEVTSYKVYADFKAYAANVGNTENLLKDMLAYAERYSVLMHGFKNPKFCVNIGQKTQKTLDTLDDCIFRLNYLETTVTRRFLLEVLRLWEEKKLTDSELQEIFLTVENYIFRRTMCGVKTNTLNKTFLILHKEIKDFDGTEDNYAEKFKFAIKSKQGNARFPDDVEFAKAFAEQEIYTNMRKSRVYILERLNNFSPITYNNVYEKFENKRYSIEHIMPQTLSKEWRDDLGPDYDRVHKTWLHRIANLTITAYNSEAGNDSFQRKKTDDVFGFDKTGLRLSSWIAKQDKWTETELEERSKALTEDALKIWPMPKSSFAPSAKPIDTYCLVEEDDDRLTNRQIAKFEFMGDEYPAKNWRDMFKQVLTILHSEEKSVLYGLAANDDGDLAKYVSTDREKLKSPLEIDNGIFVYGNLSARDVADRLRKFLAAYEVDPSELTFCLRDKNEAADGADDPDEE